MGKAERFHDFERNLRLPLGKEEAWEIIRRLEAENEALKEQIRALEEELSQPVRAVRGIPYA